MNQAETPLNDPDGPEEFLRKQGYRRKLRGHTELVTLLLEKGFTAYMVWRYLVEKRGLSVSRNTVLRFTRAVRSAAALESKSDGGTTSGSQNIPEQISASARAVAAPPSVVPTVPGERLSASAARPAESGAVQATARTMAVVHYSDPPNSDRTQAAFDQNAEESPPTITAPRSSAMAPTPGFLRPFNGNDPAFIRAEQELRRGGSAARKEGTDLTVWEGHDE